jgi:hypothetical protein
MKALMAAFAALALSGCAVVSKPLTDATLSQLKQGSTAVLFYDDIGEIKYLEDHYAVLAVTQDRSKGAYTGIWNSNAELSQLHAEQFAQLGLRTQSAYTLLSASYVHDNSTIDRTLYTLKPQEKSRTASSKLQPTRQGALTPQLRDALMAQDQDSLIWIAWTGLTLYMPTLGLSPRETISARYWVFDLKKNQILWHGQFDLMEMVSMGEMTGKEFLESNNLRGLKSQVSALNRTLYDPQKRGGKDVGTAMGLR